ncbi:hypothetical protein RND71_036150 [Anisodus tanguticus]|uniref:Uncharacterized protein n=1 Tax=Anisodus tanguticus TaxID=243964 RepID=A0AAE1R5L9_9SOLA|nr:hypothetical protein RND71_036150 [Anisodus tanguticus]
MFDINQSFDIVGFPLKIEIIVKQRPSSLASPYYILKHQTEKTFWIPYDDIFSNNAPDIISKIIFLMNVPFSLDYQLKWRCISYTYDETVAILENRDTLISKTLEFARSMKDCPSLPSDKDWSMTLSITKVTYLPDREFMEKYNNMEAHYNFEVWIKTQRELDSLIVVLQALQKELSSDQEDEI